MEKLMDCKLRDSVCNRTLKFLLRTKAIKIKEVSINNNGKFNIDSVELYNNEINAHHMERIFITQDRI